jgi:hypothetical protein
MRNGHGFAEDDFSSTNSGTIRLPWCELDYIKLPIAHHPVNASP